MSINLRKQFFSARKEAELGTRQDAEEIPHSQQASINLFFLAMSTCTDIESFFVSEANRISNDPSYRVWTTTPWDTNEIVPKTRWPDGMGATPNFLVYERSLPLNSQITFQTYGFNDGGEGDAGGSCTPPTVTIYQATTRRAMELKLAAVQSEKICIEDARMAYEIVQQGSNILRNLQNNTRFAWANQRRDEFTDVVSNKVVLDAAGTTSSSAFGTGTIGTLNREILDYWYDRLVADGAHQNNGLGTNQYGQPVLPLILSREAQATLVNNDTTINNIRWSNSSNNLLLGPRGSFVNLEGFKHSIDMQAPRWNLVGGSWVRVPFFLPASSAGEQADINPAYYTADYEDLFIGSNQVVKFAIPDAMLNAGELKFAAQDYLGNFKWINKYDLECNPDENIGYFRGKMGYGAQPGIPEYGAVIRFRRCPLDWAVNTQCS